MYATATHPGIVTRTPDGTRHLLVYSTAIPAGPDVIVHRVPRWDTFVRSNLERLPALADACRTELPDDVVVLLERARTSRLAAEDVTDTNAATRATAAAAIASGADVDRELAKAAKVPDDARRAQAEERRQTLLLASERALQDALAALHAKGDDLLVPLRIAHDQAVATPASRDSEHRIEAVHEMVATLRQLGAVPSLRAASLLELRFHHPDAVHRWQLDRARLTKVTSQTIRGSLAIETLTSIDPPAVTLADISVHPEWGAGIPTAAEILANVERILDTDEQAINGLAA